MLLPCGTPINKYFKQIGRYDITPDMAYIFIRNSEPSFSYILFFSDDEEVFFFSWILDILFLITKLFDTIIRPNTFEWYLLPKNTLLF